MSLRTAFNTLSRSTQGVSPCPSSSRLFSTSSLRLAPSSALPPPASKYTLPKGLQLTGTVTSTGKMASTITVSVERRMTDHKTLKEFSKHTKYLVHDPSEQCVVGDQVQIRNCRPVSARKRFELVGVTKESVSRASKGVADHPTPAATGAGAAAQA
ncbi:hypothetical protein JCM8097_001716 [Rhodosporidiobolus ruineniae]